MRLAFTPCLQYQYAAGKNTSDIALALDAIEAMFDERADTFCLVSSDSDFAYLCRKLRERGATVYIVGETKTLDALRNPSDQFFEWTRAEGIAPTAGLTVATAVPVSKDEALRLEPVKPLPKPHGRPGCSHRRASVICTSGKATQWSTAAAFLLIHRDHRAQSCARRRLVRPVKSSED